MMAKAATATAGVQEKEAGTTEGKELVTDSGNKALATADEDLAAFDGISSGFENVGASDLLIPRLTIIQALSPQVTQGEPEFDPNARVGMIYDVGLQEGFAEGVQIIPVHYKKEFLEWAPRSSGKGLVNIHATDEILNKTKEDDRGRAVLDNGNYIAETAQFYIMNLTAGGRKSFIPMASTQLKKGRRLLTLATAEKRSDGSAAPLFYRTYNLTTVPESNAEGKWMGWKIERGPKVMDLDGWRAILEDIKNFRKTITTTNVRGDMSGVAGENRSSPKSDDIPF